MTSMNEERLTVTASIVSISYWTGLTTVIHNKLIFSKIRRTTKYLITVFLLFDFSVFLSDIKIVHIEILFSHEQFRIRENTLIDTFTIIDNRQRFA